MCCKVATCLTAHASGRSDGTKIAYPTAMLLVAVVRHGEAEAAVQHG